GDDRPIFAFEPIESTVKRAAATLALNGITNVRLFHAAVGDNDGTISLFSAGDNSALASKDSSHLHGQVNEMTVACRKLDTLMDQGVLAQVALLKIDVEGMEPEVVHGAQRLIERDRPSVLFEYNLSFSP